MLFGCLSKMENGANGGFSEMKLLLGSLVSKRGAPPT
jgi:hypothetical protein